MSYSHLIFEIIGGIIVLYELVTRLQLPFVTNRLLGKLYFSSRRVEREVAIINKEVRIKGARSIKIIGCGGGSLVGGYIVGGLLASTKYLYPAPFLPLELERPQDFKHRGYIPRPESLQYVLKQLSGDDYILLVDDLSKRGDTIKNAIDSLTKHGIRGENIEVAVIARYSDKLVQEEFEGSLPFMDDKFWKVNICNHVARTSKIKFPWQV